MPYTKRIWDYVHGTVRYIRIALACLDAAVYRGVRRIDGSRRLSPAADRNDLDMLHFEIW